MADDLLINTDPRGVCTLSLNRPDRHNAFDDTLIAELITALKRIDKDTAVRVLVFTGEGESFSSGADLNWMRAAAQYDEAANKKDAEQLAELMHTLYHLSKPTLARVNGPTFGGGLGLIACCDIAIAETTAMFAFTEVRLGLVPAVISPYVLQAIGPRNASKLFLSGERFSSGEALRIGLVHQVVDKNKLDDAVEHQVDHLLKAGPVAVKTCKQMIHDFSGNKKHETLAALIAKLRVSAEGQEGLNAFLEKRKPKWIRDK